MNKVFIMIKSIINENKIIVIFVCICFGFGFLSIFFLNFQMIVWIYLVMSLLMDFNVSKVMGILSKYIKIYNICFVDV